MTTNYLPELAPFLGGDLTETVRKANAPAAPNLFTSGLASGFFEGISSAASGLSGLGKLTGNEYLERQGQAAAQEQAELARQYGRPDLEGSLFEGGVGGFLPRVGYQLSKTVPTLATAIAAGALVPEAAIPAGVAKAAGYVPKVLRAGQTGAEFARAGLGAFAAQYPAIAGGMFAQAQEREAKGGEKASAGDAAKAFLLGVPVTALGAIEPASATGLISKGATGSLGKRVLGAGAFNAAAAEGIQEGIEEAANMSFRPDISTNDKFKAIVDATVTGGILGGITGGALGIHKAKERPQDITNQDLGNKVDEVLRLPAPGINVPPGGFQQEPKLLEPPLDRNRPPLRNPVITPETSLEVPVPPTTIEGVDVPRQLGYNIRVPEGGFKPFEPGLESGRDIVGGQLQPQTAKPQRFDPLIEKMKENEKEIGELTGLLEGEHLGKDVASKVKQRIQKLKNNNSELAKSSAGDLTQQIKDYPDLFKNPEVHGQVETELNNLKAKKQKPSEGLKKLAQDLGILNENGRPRDIDGEFDRNSNEIDVTVKKLQEPKAKNNPGLQKKLQTKLESLTKIHDELYNLKQLRDQSDALREQRTTEIPIREAPQGGEGIRSGDTQRQETTGTQETIVEKPVEETKVGDVKTEEVKPQVGTEEHAQTQTKVLDATEPATIQELINEQVSPSGDLAPKPIKKTPAQLQREWVLAARQAVPSDTEFVRERPKRPQFSKEVRQAGINARKEAEKVEQANESIQKVTKDKQDAQSRLERARQEAENQPPLHQATKEYLEDQNQQLQIPKVYKAFEKITGGKYNTRVRIADLHDELNKLGIKDFNERAKLIQQVGRSENADLLQLDNRINITDRDRATALQVGAEPRHLLWITDKPSNIKFKRSIQERIDSIPTDNAFDRGFKKAIDVLGESTADRIDVVNTVNDLPEDIKEVMRAQGLKGATAVYDGSTGHTILVKDQFKTVDDVQRTIFHEIIGHEGLQRIAGKDFNHVMDEIFLRAGGVEAFQKLATKFGVNKEFDDYINAYKNGDLSRIQLVDEFMAHAAERPKGKIGATFNAWIGDIKKSVVSFLRSIGFNEFANKFNKFDQYEVASMLRDMRQAVTLNGEVARPVRDAVMFKRSIDGTEATFADATQLGQQILQNIQKAGFGPKNITNKLREVGLYWSHLTHIAEMYGKDLNYGPNKIVEAWHNRDVAAQRFNENAGILYREISKLSKKTQELFDNIASASQFEFDLRKSWDAHVDLHNLPNAKELEAEFKSLQKDLKAFEKASPGTYVRAIALGESENYAKAASDLFAVYNLLYRNEDIKGFDINPVKAYQNAQDVHGNIELSRDFWKNIVDQQKQGIKEFVERAKTNAPRLDLQPLEGVLSRVERRLKDTEDAPYFPLGRQGNYFVTFNLPLDERGLPNAEKLGKLQNTFEANGFGDVSLKQASDNSGVYMRVENEDVLATLYALAKKLQNEGVIAQDKEILGGPRNQPNILERIAPKYTDKLLAAIDKHVEDIDPAQQKVRDAMKAEMRSMILDTLPDKSITRVYQTRKGRQGYSKDMARNLAFRSQVTSNAISNLAILTDVSEAFGQMRKAALEQTAKNPHKAVELNQVINELATREGQRPFQQPNSVVDAIRGLNFSYFLGLSPAYVAQQLTQIPLTGLPELAKQPGVSFAKAGKALASTTTTAFNIMREVSKGKYGLDAHITKDALGNASDKQKDYVLQLVNRGAIDLGSFGRELTRIEHGRVRGKVDNALRFANSSIVYSETFTRLQMALAAEKLGLSVDQAEKVLDNSMFTYGSWNSPRAIGKMGIFGSFSPFAFAFQNFQIHMMEKLYRELHGAFSRTGSPADRAASRKFLKGHLAAATVFAGSLGLPGAAFLAAAGSRLSDLFDEDGEGFDVQTAYRNWLAQSFGKDFGEVIAHGLPRKLLNADFSSVGDQNIIPFTNLMADRRKFEEAFPAYLKDISGAPFSMLGNLVIGGRKISEGDFLGGMQQMVPRAFRAGVDAFRMTNEGYVDSKGNKLPLTVDAQDILVRAIGFQPSERAEYNEAAQAVRVQKGQESYRAGVIKASLARAIESGNKDAARDALKQAQDFDTRHPDRAILPGFASYLQRRQKDKIIAEQLNTPLGVRPENLGLRGLTEFANF